MKLIVSIYQDGENDPVGLDDVVKSWLQVWNDKYKAYAELEFRKGSNLKVNTSVAVLPEITKKIISVRNPDIYFVEASRQLELGGIEITVHSPDGSNVEKRYPYLWASRKYGINAFVACPYSKERPNGQVNRLPFRHSNQNSEFLNAWDPLHDPHSSLYQIVPTIDLQSSQDGIPPSILNNMMRWQDFGEFFAHVLAAKTLPEDPSSHARHSLEIFRGKLISLTKACKDNTNDTDATSLLKLPGRWIQIYNIRPEVGHWERGEGQFDSIDGRIMFTLDQISFLPEDERPGLLEFWLPQMVSRHPWIVEQIERGYGSKRFRNIYLVLRNECRTKFADQLNSEDWSILIQNPGLLLERLDWSPSLFRISDTVSQNDRAYIASVGLRNAPAGLIAEIKTLLSDETIILSAHRAYLSNWHQDLNERLQKLPADSKVLIPRIPKQLLVQNGIWGNVPCQILPAEDCNKYHLLMLRQIHRTYGADLMELG